ncbi:MAG: transposase, partial [Meiothermus silvanus]|nr:transposase [Allomeiothermus silvanus]
MRLRAYKYRLYPTPAQAELLAKQFGCCRYVYNWALEQKSRAYQENKKGLSRFELDKRLTSLKKELPWLAEVASHPLQQALIHLDKGFTRFFREKKGYPRFKSKRGRQSATFPQGFKVEFAKGVLVLPKLGAVRAVYSRTFEGKVKTVTVSKTPTGKFYASVLVEEENQPSIKPDVEENAVGVDLGLKHFAVLSTGEKVLHPKHLEKHLGRLRALQRRLSRKKKGGSNYRKAKRKVALLHERVANSRADFLHKLSSDLVARFDTICLEDLSVQGMMANGRLARHIGQSGWARFVFMLGYKAAWNGKHVRTIGRFEPSSRLCYCGYYNRTLTLADREWDCPDCGRHHDRDELGANNIKRFAYRKPNTGRDTPGELG